MKVENVLTCFFGVENVHKHRGFVILSAWENLEESKISTWPIYNDEFFSIQKIGALHHGRPRQDIYSNLF